MKNFSSLTLTAFVAIGIWSCESKIEFNNTLEYTYGIWPGSTHIFSDGNFEYFDSVFTSWEHFETQSAHARGNTREDWYADGDLQIQRYADGMLNSAQTRYNELVQAAAIKDWGEGKYSRKGIYFFISRNLRASQDEYLKKQDFPDFEYNGGIRSETAPITIKAAELDSATVECTNFSNNGVVKARLNHFKVFTADSTIITDCPFISAVNVAYNDATSKNEVKVYFSCTEQTVSKLIEQYGSDYYLITFIDVTIGQDTITDYFAAQTPIKLTASPD